MTKLNAATDFSTGKLLFCVTDDSGKLLFESTLELSGRDSSGMIPWIMAELESNSCLLKDIQNWTCGMGPGSFTGLRIVAALISGLTFNSSANVRGVPSGIAIAAEAVKPSSATQKIAVLYDGRRKEALCYDLTVSENGMITPSSSDLPIITEEDSSILNDFDMLVAMDSEKDALQKVVPVQFFNTILFLDTFPVQKLIDIDNFPWDRDSLLHPVYLRPAVHAKPAKIRKDV